MRGYKNRNSSQWRNKFLLWSFIYIFIWRLWTNLNDRKFVFWLRGLNLKLINLCFYLLSPQILFLFISTKNVSIKFCFSYNLAYCFTYVLLSKLFNPKLIETKISTFNFCYGYRNIFPASSWLYNFQRCHFTVYFSSKKLLIILVWTL